MNIYPGMRYSLLMITAIIFLCESGSAQIANLQKQEKSSDPLKYSTLMFSADYVTNTNVMGNFNPETRQPSFSPSLFFFSKWGVDISAGGYFVGNSDDSLDHFTSELDLMLGYTLQPVDGFTIYPSYTHFFHSSNSNALKSIFSDDIRLDVDYNYRFLNLGVSSGFYLGKKNTFYTSIHNYYDIQFDRFLSSKGTLSIQPGVDANFGSYEYLNLYYLDELRKEPYLYLYLLSYPAIRRYVIAEILKNPELTKEEVLDDYLIDKAQDDFKLTSVSINLPFFYIIGNFGINMGLYLMIPVGQPDYLSDEAQFFFDIGVTYNLEFGKK